jgi:hypothetical protein
MPEASEYLPLGSKAGKVIEGEYNEEAARRGAMIKRAWAYYDGDHKPPLKIQADGYDDNVILNDVEVLADKLGAFLVGDGLEFDAAGDDERTEADEQIADLWEVNRGGILQSNLALSGVLEGHVAVRLVPQEGQDWPAIQQIKQAHFSAFWDPFDMSQVTWYRLQSGMRRIDYVRGLSDGSTTDPARPVWSELTYQGKVGRKDVLGVGGNEIEWELTNVEVWDFDWPPIVDWQNLPNPNWYYGRSDAASAIKLNDNINFLMSNLNRIVKYFAHPRTVGTGFTTDELLATAVGGLWSVENPEAKIYNLEMTTDAALSRWLADVISQNLWQSGGLVDPQTMKDKVGQLTNFGLRVLFSDAISRIDKKRLLYGEAFEAIINRAFVLQGIAPPDTLTIIWPDVLPDDAEAEMRTLTAEYDRGLISQETYRERRGYNNEQEENRIADEGQTGDIGSQILSNISFNRGQ